MVCYIPGTGTLAAISVAIYILWHKAIAHFLGMVGAAMQFVLVALALTAAVLLVRWTARVIQQRRAEAGACTTCRFRCQQALMARPHLLVNMVDRRLPASKPVPRSELTCHPAAPILGWPRPAPRHAAIPAPQTAAARQAARALQTAVSRRTLQTAASRRALAPALAPALALRAAASRRAFSPVRVFRTTAPRRASLAALAHRAVTSRVPVPEPAPLFPVLSAPVPVPPPAAVRGEPASATARPVAVHHEPGTARTRRPVLSPQVTPPQVTPPQVTPGQVTPGQVTPGQVTPGQSTQAHAATAQAAPPPVAVRSVTDGPFAVRPATPVLVRPRSTPTAPAEEDESVAYHGYVLTPEGVDLEPEPDQASVTTRAKASM